MIHFFIALVVSWIAVLLFGWYGTNILFHPPKRTPLSLWPDDFDFNYKDIEFKTSDGVVIRGWLIPCPRDTDQTILLCHGWGDNKGDMLQRTDFLHAHFNLFYFDFRHHGDSAGDYTSLCALETLDIAAALDALRKAKPSWAERLGLVGFSMGSGAATWATAHDPSIKALLLEAPFWSFNGVIARWIKNQYYLPRFPFAAAMLWVCRKRLGMDPERLCPLEQIAQVSPRPLFIIAGEKDNLMRLPTVQELFAAARDPKELWVIPEARHGKCRELAEPEYVRRFVDFFRKHL